jgi:DNA-binding transcriptional regulator YhcF (GntR family)
MTVGPSDLAVAAHETSGASGMRVVRNTVTLRQQVLEVLRNGILSFQFKPGDRLIERELCEMTGVSRTSVREALRHLESEGLVQNLPKQPMVLRYRRRGARDLRGAEGLARLLPSATLLSGPPSMPPWPRSSVPRRRRHHEILKATTAYYDGAQRLRQQVIRRLIGLQARVTFLRATRSPSPAARPRPGGDAALDCGVEVRRLPGRAAWPPMSTALPRPSSTANAGRRRGKE